MSRSLPFFSSYATSSLELNAKDARNLSSLPLRRSLSIPFYIYSPLSLYLSSSRSLVLSGPSGAETARAVQLAQTAPSSVLLSTAVALSITYTRTHSPPRISFFSPPRSEIQPFCTPSRFHSHHRRRFLPHPLVIVFVAAAAATATSPRNPNVKGIETM